MRIHGLTPHQYNIAERIARGDTDKSIRKELSIRQPTLRFHVARIALAWRIDASKNLRVEIAKRFTAAA